jgi:hypothetical protein
MKWIARTFVFTAALVLGSFAGSLFGTDAAATSLSARDLVGTWEGNFGRDSGDCTIVITRAEGDMVYGTLEKDGALVRFEGYFNAKTRKFYFEETSVMHLGSRMDEWSLGRNSAVLSQDARTLTGDGYDRWGQYYWSASNY